jgi:hypothetical protein
MEDDDEDEEEEDEDEDARNAAAAPVGFMAEVTFDCVLGADTGAAAAGAAAGVLADALVCALGFIADANAELSDSAGFDCAVADLAVAVAIADAAVAVALLADGGGLRAVGVAATSASSDSRLSSIAEVAETAAGRGAAATVAGFADGVPTISGFETEAGMALATGALAGVDDTISCKDANINRPKYRVISEVIAKTIVFSS